MNKKNLLIKNPSNPAACKQWQTHTNQSQFDYIPALNGPGPEAAAAGWTCTSWNPSSGKMTCFKQVCVAY